MSVRALLVGAAAAAIATSVYATTISFGMQPGLWAFTVKMQMSASVIPPETLARMTPAQRARAQAAMAAANTPRVVKRCITPEQARNGFDLDEARQCTHTTVSSSSSQLVMHVQCRTGRGTGAGTVTFQLVDAGNVRTDIKMTVTTHGRTVTVENQSTGKWLGSDCGNVKPLAHPHTPPAATTTTTPPAPSPPGTAPH